MEQLTLWSEGALARLSASLGTEGGSQTSEGGSCSSTFELFVRSVLDGSFGRTSRARSRARAGRLSDACSGSWMGSVMVWRGEVVKAVVSDGDRVLDGCLWFRPRRGRRGAL